MNVTRIVLVVAVLMALVAVGIASSVPLTSDRARRAVVAALEDRLDGTVDLESFRFQLLPTLRVEGTGLTIRHEGRRDVPPIISIRRFSVSGSLVGVLRRHARSMAVEGLDINIPPRRPGADDGGRRRAPAPAMGSFVIDELESVDARLTLVPSEPGRRAKTWSIHRLRMQSVGDRSMPFDATVTNAVPPGEIEAKGSFGPWDREEPGQTPLEGSFAFDRADLSVFKGISGILSSRGSFGGALARIEVQGETATPEFVVAVGGHPVPLHTRYSATVDGTNGDTILNRVDASFLKTAIVARGRVVSTAGVEGRMVQMDVAIEQGRIEDVLRLAIKTPQPMVGALSLQTALVLPPGKRDVVEKLLLDGRFSLSDARFTNVDVSRKITELSQRGRGLKPDSRGRRVSSNFEGLFKLAEGRLTIPAVAFDVPGASVRLAGTYDLERENLDFRGTLLTDAKVSQMTSGIKRYLLKLIDPLFGRDGGGSAVPFKVAGTRSDPTFGLDTRRVFSRDRTAPVSLPRPN